jgi:hypothetical protein
LQIPAIPKNDGFAHIPIYDDDMLLYGGGILQPIYVRRS